MVDLICETCKCSYSRIPSVASYSRFCSARCRIEAVSEAARRPLAERFWEKVAIKDPSECWEWTGGRFSDGYGAISVDGKAQRAPRVALHLTGINPDGLHVRHSCDNPACVNPKHLSVGTAQDNANDKVSRGRQSRVSKISDKQVLEIYSSKLPHKILAEKYGVSAGLVNLIKYNPNYRSQAG